MKVQLIPFEERFGQTLFQSAFPLPIPAKVKLPPAETKTKWWAELLDFAEKYVHLSQTELTYDVPRRLWAHNPKNPLIASLHAELTVGMRFYARWVRTPPEEDLPANFPRGLKVLVDNAREDVLHAVRISKAEDWAQHIVDEYFDAFDRCRRLCDATRRGHLAEFGEPLSFSASHVEKIMQEDTKGFVGLVNYNHIRKMLLLIAQPEASNHP